jgi:hypothetical protein
MNEDKQPEPTPAPTPETSEAKAEKEPRDTPRKPGYVFKIAPADPKNAFDFEDVADK